MAGAGGTTGGVAGGTAGGVTGAGGALGADDTEGAGVMAGALLASLAGCSAAPGAMVFLQLVRAASVMIASMMVVFMGWISECRHIPPPAIRDERSPPRMLLDFRQLRRVKAMRKIPLFLPDVY